MVFMNGLWLSCSCIIKIDGREKNFELRKHRLDTVWWWNDNFEDLRAEVKRLYIRVGSDSPIEIYRKALTRNNEPKRKAEKESRLKFWDAVSFVSIDITRSWPKEIIGIDSVFCDEPITPSWGQKRNAWRFRLRDRELFTLEVDNREIDDIKVTGTGWHLPSANYGGGGEVLIPRSRGIYRCSQAFNWVPTNQIGCASVIVSRRSSQPDYPWYSIFIL